MASPRPSSSQQEIRRRLHWPAAKAHAAAEKVEPNPLSSSEKKTYIISNEDVAMSKEPVELATAPSQPVTASESDEPKQVESKESESKQAGSSWGLGFDLSPSTLLATGLTLLCGAKGVNGQADNFDSDPFFSSSSETLSPSDRKTMSIVFGSLAAGLLVCACGFTALCSGLQRCRDNREKASLLQNPAAGTMYGSSGQTPTSATPSSMEQGQQQSSPRLGS